MMTLEDLLLELEITPEPTYPCTICKRPNAPFAMRVTGPDAVTVSEDEIIDHVLVDPADPEGEREPVSTIIQTVTVNEAICTDCKIGELRRENHRKEKAEKEKLAQEKPWETDKAKHIKAERNRRIDAARWAVDPLTSPLSGKAQADYVKYIKALNRMTLDFPNPDSVVWPVEPALEYPT